MKPANAMIENLQRIAVRKTRDIIWNGDEELFQYIKSISFTPIHNGLGSIKDANVGNLMDITETLKKLR